MRPLRKCRRIVSMLSALGADPTGCGYTAEQIARCLSDITRHGINQEAEDAEHLAFLLHEMRLISEPTIGPHQARERREVMNLRFDREKAPFESIPLNLRERLYHIYLEHADGALRRRGKTWTRLDLTKDPALRRPFLFEPPAPPLSCKHPGNEEREATKCGNG